MKPSLRSIARCQSSAARLLAWTVGAAAFAALSPSAIALVSVTGVSVSVPVLEGSTDFMLVSVSSTRSLQGFSVTVDWGDGTTSGNGGFSQTSIGHVYADDGVYNATFAGTGTEYTRGFLGQMTYYTNAIEGAATITVLNVAPTITDGPADKSLNLLHGTLLNVSASATDPGVSDVLSYSWDLDSDGLYDDLEGALGQFDYAGFPDVSYLLGLKVSDGDGGVDTHEFTLVINSVPDPVPHLLLSPAGAGTRLEWDADATGYQLQTSVDLSGWTDLGSVITGSGSYDDVGAGRRGFYRLFKP